MKTLAPHYVGDWESRGAALRLRGLNRLGDLLVPNLNYVALEEWFMPLLRRMHDEQGGGADGRSPLRRVWTPSAVIARMGAELTDESSVWYWAARNRIPVFCPGLTDGAIGDMLFFHSWDRPGFLLDVAGDVRRINKAAMRAKKSGMVILGGGTPKHHTCNANLMRNGADFAVFVNTGAEFDGSDAGARPDEEADLDPALPGDRGHLVELGVGQEHDAAPLADAVDGDAEGVGLLEDGPQRVRPLDRGDLDPPLAAHAWTPAA